jgi:lactoylglutathione lyase
MAIVRMLHVALGVSDLGRAVAFYRDALGFAEVATHAHDAARVARVLGSGEIAVEGTLLRRDGVLLQLLRREGAGESPPSALVAHLALAVDDLASTLHSLRDRGAEVDERTLVEHAPGVRTCVVRDPDGLAILLCEAPAGATSAWDDDA